MKTTSLLTLPVFAGAILLLAPTPRAVAAVQFYDFTFTGNDGIDATGTIGIDGGVAVSGSITVTGVPLEATPSTLVTASGALLTPDGDVRNHDGDVVTYDTVVNPSNDPIFDSTGVAFGSGYFGTDGGTPEDNTLINIWGNSPGSYGMFIGEANVDANGNVIGDPQWVYVYDEPGTLTLASIPESAKWTNSALLGALMSGSLAIRRRRAAVSWF
ncbi:MAG TPA: hypothetical protein VGN23_14925 [Verrucomicrobiae bacterium]|jgi:hypothetical protein|nr:hypothetical protein [Verrucomicrobiae bacterium]